MLEHASDKGTYLSALAWVEPTEPMGEREGDSTALIAEAV